VTPQSDITLYTLEREDFLEAVTGQPESVEAADAISEERAWRTMEVASPRQWMTQLRTDQLVEGLAPPAT
jgi:hypothetical protein